MILTTFVHTRARRALACTVAAVLLLGTAPACGRDLASADELYQQGQRQLPAHWRGLGSTAEAAVFVQADTKKTPDGHYMLWRSRELVDPGYFDKEQVFRSIRERIVVDCAGRRIGVNARAYLAGHFGTGTVAASSEVAPVEWSMVLPDTLDEQLLRSVCKPKQRKVAGAQKKT